STRSDEWQTNVERAGAAVDFAGYDTCQRRDGWSVLFDQRLSDSAAIDIVSHGPALGCRSAGHSIEVVVLCDAGVGRRDDRPRSSGPLLGERLVNVAVVGVAADGPTIRCRRACHATEVAGRA